MKRILIVLIVLVNLVVFAGIVFLIVRFEYREDEYGVPGGTPITGLVLLLKLILVLVCQIAVNLLLGKQSSNAFLKQGLFIAGGVLSSVLVFLLLRSLIR